MSAAVASCFLTCTLNTEPRAQAQTAQRARLRQSHNTTGRMSLGAAVAASQRARHGGGGGGHKGEDAYDVAMRSLAAERKLEVQRKLLGRLQFIALAAILCTDLVPAHVRCDTV